MKRRVGFLFMLATTAAPAGCNDHEDTTGQPEELCLSSEPRRIFPGETGELPVTGFGRADELYHVRGAGLDDLFFEAGQRLYLSGSCGEELRDVTDAQPHDGLRYLHDDVALDCESGAVLRRGAGGALEPVYEGVSCDAFFETEEGLFAVRSSGQGGESSQVIRLFVHDAPELPVAPLSDEVLVESSFSEYVGPHDVPLIELAPRRFLTGHWSDPYVRLTPDGRVLRLDPHGAPATVLKHGVASLWASPNGEAFAYQSLLPDGTAGELIVRSADGQEHLFAAAGELAEWTHPWWSSDGRWFAAPISASNSDRLIALPTGQVWTTDEGTKLMRDVPGGGLWLTQDAGDVFHELYWEPLSGVRRELWSHAQLPMDSVRAAEDGLELLIPRDGSLDPFWWGEGDLIVAPYDGSSPKRLSQRVSPGYTRLADGRVVTPRGDATENRVPKSADLVLIDPATGAEEVLDRGAARGRWSPTIPESSSDFTRIIGDRLLYNIVDDVRIGVLKWEFPSRVG